MNPRLLPLLALATLSCAHPAPRSLPGHLEPHHHVRFQNGYVRVLETLLEPGQETGAHSHPTEAVIVFLTEGRFEITSDDGSVRQASAARHEVVFGSSPLVHRTRNLLDVPCRTLAVEVFTRPPAPGRGAVDFEDQEVLVDNEQVRASRVRLEPGGPLDLSGASSSVLVALTPGTLGRPGTDGADDLDAGDVRWSDPGQGSVENRGDDPFEAVLVLLKPRE